MNIFKKLFYNLVWLLKGIQVSALIGRSGTGKSFRAMLLAKKYHIELIIDDGLLIREQKIIAGKSAKREKIYLSAIKTALFTDKNHAIEVKKALEKEKFKRILIIGTSKRMVVKITRQLNLPSPSKYILIEDIATEEEIKAAIHTRKKEGKHIIPVPAIEVKRNYPYKIIETIKLFVKKSFFSFRSKKTDVIEKTVVRPEFSKRGVVSISESALSQMVFHCVNEFDPSIEIEKVRLRKDMGGFRLEVMIQMPFGIELSESVSRLQKYILNNIEQFTGIILKSVDITVSTISKKDAKLKFS